MYERQGLELPRPKSRTIKSPILLTRARLDWTDRRPPPACSANGRYACPCVLDIDPHSKITTSERVSHVCARRALPPNLTSTSRACQTACCLQAAGSRSTEIPRIASCVALADSQSMRARHTERADWLRGTLGEAEERERSCMLECAWAGTAASGAIFQRTARASGRGRTWRTGAVRFEPYPTEVLSPESWG